MCVCVCVCVCACVFLSHSPLIYTTGADFVQIGRHHPSYELLLNRVMELNGVSNKVSIKRLDLSHIAISSCASRAAQDHSTRSSIQSPFASLPLSRVMWDVVVADVVNPQGMLRAGVFEELSFLRFCFFGGFFLVSCTFMYVCMCVCVCVCVWVCVCVFHSFIHFAY